MCVRLYAGAHANVRVSVCVHVCCVSMWSYMHHSQVKLMNVNKDRCLDNRRSCCWPFPFVFHMTEYNFVYCLLSILFCQSEKSY